jgi:hypothetical protein
MTGAAALRQAAREMMGILWDEYLSGCSTKGGDITYFEAGQVWADFEEEQGEAARDAAWDAELRQLKAEFPNESFFRWYWRLNITLACGAGAYLAAVALSPVLKPALLDTRFSKS